LARLRRAARDRLGGSGLPGTTTGAVFAADLLCWLTSRFPGQLTIDWPNFEEPDRLDPVLRHALSRAEQDAFDGGLLSTRDWVRIAAGPPAGELSWLCAQRPSADSAGRLWAHQLDALELPVRWRLTKAHGSVTTLRWNQAPMASRGIGLRRTSGAPTRWIGQPLEDLVLLTPEVATAAIGVSRAALAMRGREVHAITAANPDEVYLADLGEGVSAVIMGARLDARMSLEANYGYVLFGNGVPIGYGGVTPLFHQANTGLHIFSAFRGGEAGAIYLQLLRAFRTLFGVSLFLLNPIQVGEENEEALASGAFWFYHRLGFRPVDPGLRALAGTELGRRRTNPRYRTDRAALVRLGEGDLVLSLPGTPHRLFQERWLHELSLAVTRSLATGDGPRRNRIRQLTTHLASALGVRSRARWKPEERDAFTQLAPLLSLLDLKTWPASHRRALIGIIRAKGAPQERGFVSACQRFPRLRVELEALARRSPDAGRT
ncbi:MAG: hypothetical protein AAB075_07950, partial [Gemmatimonadota bacterium]